MKTDDQLREECIAEMWEESKAFYHANKHIPYVRQCHIIGIMERFAKILGKSDTTQPPKQ